MVILGIETSCDETGIALVENGTKILANSLATSADLHTQTGGIIPEAAAREQVKAIIPTLKQALSSAHLELKDVDALAVTYGPGLIGSLLVGVETAKTLSFGTGKPIIPVNHMWGHLYAAWLENPEPPQFPLISLIVSGGHTDILKVTGHGQITWLGGTRDDAAGEAFDKTARLLGLPYPGGPAIARLAATGKPTAFKLPRPLWDSGDLDFSFSGLKTAVFYHVKEKKLTPEETANLAWEVEDAITDLLVTKTVKAAQDEKINTISLGGGVASNQRLKAKLRAKFQGDLVIPEPKYCTDNGAMIAAAAFFNKKEVPWAEIKADPSLHY